MNKPTPAAQPTPCRVFLSHNSRDKDLVKQVAEALSLEFGIPHFLDEYAIPTGEAFLAWIERSLQKSTGCAIFLGERGWGPTHLWEAEKALVRYREDPDFRIVPVVLPGAKDEDMARLGNGTLFQELNWADLRTALDDPPQIDKLRRALTGEAVDETESRFGPDRLTPFLIRRTARRWNVSVDAGQPNTSLLYRGEELKQAWEIAREHPDLVVLADVQPFLEAGETRERRFWQHLATGSLATLAVIAVLAVLWLIQRNLARERLAESQSRQLALETRSALGPDRSLILSVEALRRAPTPEARENLLERLDALRDLEWLSRIDSEQAHSLAFDPAAERLWIGEWRGALHSLDAGDAKPAATLESPNHGAVTAVLPFTAEGEVWLGFEDGRIAVKPEGAAEIEVRPGELLFEGNMRRDNRVTALVRIGETGVAAGDAQGVVCFFGRGEHALLDTYETGSFRVEDLAASPSGELIAVGTDDTLYLLDAGTLQILDQIPVRDGGIRALGFTDEVLIAVFGYGPTKRFHMGSRELISDGTATLPPSSRAAVAEDGRVAVGTAEGLVAIYEPYFDEPLLQEVGHSAWVEALAFGATSDELFSLASDGSVASWRVAREPPLARERPKGGITPDSLVALSTEAVLAAETAEGEATIWRGDPEGVAQLLDLIEVSRELGGDEALESMQEPSEDGFTPVEPEISAVTISPAGNTVAWATRDGAVFVRSVDEPSEAGRLLARTARPVEEIRLGSGGLLAFLEGDSTLHRAFLNREDADLESIELDTPAMSLAVDGSRGRIAVGLDDGGAGLWSRNAASLTGSPTPLHRAPVSHLAFTPDGRRLLSSGSGGADRSVAVWTLPGFELEARFQSRQAGGSASGLVVSPEGKVLAVPDQLGQVLLWDLERLSPLGDLNAGMSWVSAVAFHDEHTLFTSTSERLLVWNLDPAYHARLACEKAGRSLTEDEWDEVLPGLPYEATCSEESLRELEDR